MTKARGRPCLAGFAVGRINDAPLTIFFPVLVQSDAFHSNELNKVTAAAVVEEGVDETRSAEPWVDQCLGAVQAEELRFCDARLLKEFNNRIDVGWV